MADALLFVMTDQPMRIGTMIGAALLIGGTLRLMNYTPRNILTWLVVGAVYVVLHVWLETSLGITGSSPDKVKAATIVSASAYCFGLVVGNMIVSRNGGDVGKPLRETTPEIARKELNRSGKE